MASQRFPQSRAERLIAIGRFVLAVAASGAIYLDPLEPAQSPSLTHALLAVYGVYALAVVLWNVAATTTTRRALVATHALDLVFFGVINAATFGPTCFAAFATASFTIA